jgi:hypothetical protein
MIRRWATCLRGRFGLSFSDHQLSSSELLGLGSNSGNYPILAIPAKPSTPYLGIPPHPSSSQNGQTFIPQG